MLKAHEAIKSKGYVRWAPQDVEFLKEFYASCGYKIPQLIDKFSRSAIHLKARSLGLESRKGIKVAIPKRCPFHLKQWEKGYLSAFLDGEGNISSRSNRKAFIVSMFNTNGEAIQFIQRKIGCGDISVDKRKGRQDLYSIDIRRDADVYWLLKQLYPFLIIKKEKAMGVLLCLSQKYSLPHQLPL